MGEALASEAVFDSLGNPVRRDIVRLLSSGPRSVGEIAEVLPISRPAVSKHLRLLEQAELVRHVPQGTRNVFHLQAAGFERGKQWLDSFWSEALARFALLAENLEEES